MAYVRLRTFITEHERLRRLHGLTGAQYGAALGYSDHTTVSAIERRRRPAPAAFRARAAAMFQVPEDELFDAEGYAR